MSKLIYTVKVSIALCMLWNANVLVCSAKSATSLKALAAGAALSVKKPARLSPLSPREKQQNEAKKLEEWCYKFDIQPTATGQIRTSTLKLSNKPWSLVKITEFVKNADGNIKVVPVNFKWECSPEANITATVLQFMAVLETRELEALVKDSQIISSK